MTRTRAQWIVNIPDLINRLAEAGDYLNVAQVSSETGFSVATITDLLSRPPITSKANPQGPLSRPAARIGNQPLYSPEQVAEARRRMEQGRPRHFGGGDEPLPTVDHAEARRRGLLTTAEIASLAVTGRTPLGVRDQTVRRWSRDHEDFPLRVALRARESGHSGVPMVLYEGLKAATWLVEHGYADGDPRAIFTGFRERAQRERTVSVVAAS